MSSVVGRTLADVLEDHAELADRSAQGVGLRDLLSRLQASSIAERGTAAVSALRSEF